MRPNNVLSPLPIYNELSWQQRFNNLAQGVCDPLLTPLDYLLPFQLNVTSEAVPAIKVYLVDVSSSQWTDITSDAQIEVIELGGVKVLYGGGVTLPQGETTLSKNYYLAIEYGKTYYSEQFKTCDVRSLTKITARNCESIAYVGGIIPFAPELPPWEVFLPTMPSKPEYKFEEEVLEKEGYSLILKKISFKEYKLEFAGHEFMCDMLRVISLCDTIQIDYLDKSFPTDKFDVDLSWENVGLYASITCTFRADTVLKSSGAYAGQLSRVDMNTEFGASAGLIRVLNDLNDVDTFGALNGYVLTYSSSDGIWIAAAPQGGGGGEATSVKWENVIGRPNVSTWAQQTTKPNYTAAEVGALSSVDSRIANWNTAYSWGSHATAGYAKTASPTFTGTVYLPVTYANDTQFIRSSKRTHWLSGTTLSNSSGQAYTNALWGTWGEFDDICLKTAGRNPSDGTEQFGTYMMQFGGVNLFLGKGKLKIDGNIHASKDVVAYAGSTLQARQSMMMMADYSEEAPLTDTPPDYIEILLEKINHLQGQVDQLKLQVNG